MTWGLWFSFAVILLSVPATGAAADGPVPVLDEHSPFRVFYSWNAAGADAPNAEAPGGQAGIVRFFTLFPEKDWTKPDFSVSCPVSGRSPSLPGW